MTERNPIFCFWRIAGDRNAGGPCATVFMGSTKLIRGHVPKCPGCGRLREERSYDGCEIHAEGKTAREWPDVLFGTHLVVSGRVLRDLNTSEITGFVTHPVNFHKIDSPLLAHSPAPTYHLLQATGKINVDRHWFDEWEGQVCPVCHHWQRKQGGKYHLGAKMLVPLLDTWDGSDFVTVANIAYGSQYCTTRVLDLARAKGWVGAWFGTITPREFGVGHSSDFWFEEIENKVHAEYPRLFENK